MELLGKDAEHALQVHHGEGRPGRRRGAGRVTDAAGPSRAADTAPPLTRSGPSVRRTCGRPFHPTGLPITRTEHRVPLDREQEQNADRVERPPSQDRHGAAATAASPSTGEAPERQRTRTTSGSSTVPLLSRAANANSRNGSTCPQSSTHGPEPDLPGRGHPLAGVLRQPEPHRPRRAVHPARREVGRVAQVGHEPGRRYARGSVARRAATTSPPRARRPSRRRRAWS